MIEDYRSNQLSLHANPVSFLREELAGMKIVACGDLPVRPDRRNLEVAGIVLVRQRPGSAKGGLFVTIEDETSAANAILWPDKFETYRRQIMSASMIALRGRRQKEGELIHVIADRITNLEPMLRSIGRQDLQLPHGRGDGAAHGGGPDPRDPSFSKDRVLSAPAFRTGERKDDLLPVKSHDFH